MTTSSETTYAARPVSGASSATQYQGSNRLRVCSEFLPIMQKRAWTAAVVTAALSLACFAEAQSAGAPASAPAVYSVYRRPNNSDCVASATTSLDYFPLQFQIGSSSGPTTQEQINVRRTRSLHMLSCFLAVELLRTQANVQWRIPYVSFAYR